MAQVSQIEINNQAFSTFRTTMNDSLSAINSMHSGTSRPASATTGTLWLDTTNAGSNSLTIKFFDGSDDITFATIDTSANTVNFIDSVVTGFDIVTDTTPQLGGNLDLNSNDITGTGNINITGTGTFSGDLTVDTNTLFVDASENTVVIGGTDASSWNANADELVVAGASAGGMTFYNPTQSNIFFADGTTGSDVSRGRIQYVHSGNSLIFGTDATERARIDGSGNLFIGKTASNSNVAGVQAHADGFGAFTRSGDKPLILNRLTDDGDIINLRKDGTVVGVIGTQKWGIGNSNPQNKLDISATTWDDGLTIKNTGNFNVGIIGDANRSGASGGILNLASKWNGTEVAGILFQTGSDTTNKDDGEIVFRTASSGTPQEKVRITSAGLVGIGNSNPGAGLEVTNSSGIKISRSGYSQYMQLYPANNNVPTILGLGGNGIHIGTTTTTGIHVDGSDNVLINTTSASGFDSAGLPLIVGSGSTHQGITIFSGTSHQGAIHFADGTGTSSYRGQLNYKHDADAMTFATSGSEKVRISSDGNFGISTTAPSRKLHIVSSDNQLARFESTDTYGGIELCDNTSGTAKPLISAVANDFVFYRGGSSHTVAFGATSVGFGVGIASPSEELEVSGGQNTIVKSKTTTSTALGGFEAWNNSSAYMKIYSYGSSASGSTFGGVANANVNLFESQGASNVVFSTWANAGGSNPDFIFAPQRSQKVIIKSDGNIGIGTSNPSTSIHINSNTPIITFEETDQSNRKFQIGSFGNAYAVYDATNTQYRYILDNSGNHIFNEGSQDCDFRVESNNNANMLFVDGGQDRIGIGESAPLGKFHITSLGSGATVSGDADDLIIENGTSGAASGISILSATNGYGNICFGDSGDNNIGVFQYDHNGNFMRFIVNASERARIDSSGNVFVKKTSSDGGQVGVELLSSGAVFATRDNNFPLFLNRTTSDGDIALFRKDGTTVGSIASVSSVGIKIVSGSSLDLYSDNANGVRIDSTGRLRPINDNLNDLGNTNKRWKDIYATNGTIQTSDQNEKQSIQSLTIAEMNVAKKLSALIKTFKWNTAVEKKGDSARTHTGIIAQDIQQAFTDEELDASNYALFISSTWWEKEISVEATKENNAYTYIDTKEEATDGYTEKTRLGVRYPELLSFIQAYNDQRFTELEARITTLEANNP